jgi:hypothetical protein
MMLSRLGGIRRTGRRRCSSEALEVFNYAAMISSVTEKDIPKCF